MYSSPWICSGLLKMVQMSKRTILVNVSARVRIKQDNKSKHTSWQLASLNCFWKGEKACICKGIYQKQKLFFSGGFSKLNHMVYFITPQLEHVWLQLSLSTVVGKCWDGHLWYHLEPKGQATLIVDSHCTGITLGLCVCFGVRWGLTCLITKVKIFTIIKNYIEDKQ